MSATLDNLLAAAGVLAGIKANPRMGGTWFFWFLQHRELCDDARRVFYADEASGKVFDWLQQARAIASFFDDFLPIQLPNSPFSVEEWAALEDKARAMDDVGVDGDFLLERIDTWLLESYTLKGLCEAAPGDVVLDCGAFTGGTSAYFALKVGPSGHVYALEPSPEIFLKLKNNMRGTANVTPVRSAVGDFCGSTGFDVCEGWTPAASVKADGAGRVPITTLDDFCARQKLSKVDFIKMDIEGYEAEALRGAKRVIRCFRPKMALSVYHKVPDMVELPSLIRQFDARYTFRLAHFSYGFSETVLYCIPGPAGGAKAASDESPPVPDEAERARYAELCALMAPLLVRLGQR